MYFSGSRSKPYKVAVMGIRTDGPNRHHHTLNSDQYLQIPKEKGRSGRTGTVSVRVLTLLLCPILGVFFRRFVRKQMILANTLFKCVCYHPEEYQLITAGTDRQVSKAAGIPKLKAWGLFPDGAPEPPQKGGQC